MTDPAAAPRLVRYRLDGSVHHGLVRAGGYARLSGPPWAGGEPTGALDPEARAELLTPCAPGKILCIGLNYVEHVRENVSGHGGQEPPAEPLFFLKPPSAALAPGGVIRRPAGVERLDPEGEVALVIGRRARHLREADALAHVAGVTAFDDVSARDWQRRDGQWSRAKGCDTFAPFGPCIALGLSPLDLGFELRVNGAVRQRARSSQMHFGPAFLVAYLSRFMTLEPGDVIATGTPAGVAPIVPGDRVEVEVEGVGTLANTVAEDGA